MKLNSSVVAINSKVGKLHFAGSAEAFARSRLDTVCHGLLVAAGIALNIAAAAQGFTDSRSAGVDRAQFFTNRGTEFRQIAGSAASRAATPVRDLMLPPQIGA